MSLLRYPPQEIYDDLDVKINALTNQPTLHQIFDLVGRNGHARGGQLDLGTAVQKVCYSANADEENPKLRDVANIEVYTDRLRASTPVRPHTKCDMMTIIARVAFVESNPVVFELSNSGQFSIELHCVMPAKPITFRFQRPNGSSPVDLVVDPKNAIPDHRYWGISLGEDGTDSDSNYVTSYSGTNTLSDLFERSTRSIVDMIQDGGKLADMGWDEYNDNLRKLLNYQLLLAAKVEKVNRPLSYQIAEFVMWICQGIPKAFDLYSQGNIIAASKDTDKTHSVVGQTSAMRSLVPKLDLSTAQQVLKSRLDSATAFDTAYRKLQGQDANTKNIILFANVTLDKSIDSDRVYSFMTATAQQRLTDAQFTFLRANKEFQSLQTTLKEAQDKFKAGIESWKTRQTWKAVGEVFKGIVAVAGAIALAVAAPPVGAIAIGEGAAELGTAIEESKTAVSLWQEIKDIITTIKDVYGKIEPYLKKVQELVDSVSKIMDLIKSKKSMDDIHRKDIENFEIPAIKSDDITNATADWDIFLLQMNNLHEGIKGQVIGGADEFFLTINKMVVRGKAVLAAQMGLSSASDAYLTVVQQSLAQQRHTDRLRKVIPQIQGDQLAFRIIKLAFAERLLALRSWIVLDFRQYVASYAWNSLDTQPPITIDPLKDLGSFLNDAATLQALSAQVYSNVRAQTRVFSLSYRVSTVSEKNGNGTKNGNLAENGSITALSVPDNFIEDLRSKRSASFNINCENALFQSYGRIRLSKARIFLESSTDGDTTPVSLRISLGPSMKDLSLEKTQSSTASPESAIASRVLQFVTTESTFGFEYTGNNKDILMDGAFCGFRDSSSLLLSPFRTWTIAVDSITDLEAVNGIAVELVCEVTYL
ncbi:unnamed protein product [Fusarium langsethiae]|nr:unnamed protein product [Fusarium langsethiae]